MEIRGFMKFDSLELDVETNGLSDNLVIVYLKGSLMGGTTSQLEQLLDEQMAIERRINIILDCTELEFISSAGIGSLLIKSGDAKKHKGMVKLLNLPPKIQELFKIAGFLQIFPIFYDRDEAIDSFSL